MTWLWRRSRPVAVLISAIGAAVVATVALAATAGTGGASSPGASSPDGAASGPATAPAAGAAPIPVVAAENQYASVIAQVGGRFVSVSALLSNPSTDPHTFEASPVVAREVGAARLVVQNGLGYDSFMDGIERAEPSAGRQVLTVASLLRLPASTPNPHLWYSPAAMPAVAAAVAAGLARIDPAHGAYFRASAATFTASLGPWHSALAALRAGRDGTPVATTEPVADYLLQAAGMDNKTPWAFQADIMNGVDPSPQAVATVRDLLATRAVRALVYNVQVTDPLTTSLVTLAHAHGIPVVGVYETMPQPGYQYQSWMLAEAGALARAITTRQSTERL
ncbi:MAG TPA: zinc ABC transporter substrate-binding protein [Trebonia sp.]|jgi:zinc/manganese transport system substrate-binding protein|nr:zinc ABC transporter substrate-binding protein [Trebonia sp.]